MQFDQIPVCSKSDFAFYCVKSLWKCIKQDREQKFNRTFMAVPWPYSLKEKLANYWNVEFDKLSPFSLLQVLCFPWTGPWHNCKRIGIFTALVLGTATEGKQLWNGAVGSHMHLIERSFTATKQCFFMLVLSQTLPENVGKVKEARLKFYSPLLHFQSTGLNFSLVCPGW